MSDITKEIIVGVSVWAITTFMVWILARKEALRSWFTSRPWFTAGCIGALMAALILSYTQYIVSNLRERLSHWDTAPAISRPDGYKSECPEGTYATGFEFQVESGLGHGALYTGHIICRPLNVK